MNRGDNLFSNVIYTVYHLYSRAMINKELVYKYLRNECNEDECRAVQAYFAEHPEQWDLYLNEEEWERFNESDDTHLVPSAQIHSRISEQLELRQPKLRKMLLVAAACLAPLIVITWLFIHHRNGNAAVFAKATIVPAAYKLVSKYNPANIQLQVVLPDGSQVALAPKSTIQYYEPFVVNNRRSIYLTGEARFDVAKDKTKPFVVVSGEIATTAVGTSFTVHSQKESRYISVLLHEGKVVIRSADLVSNKLAKDYYLLPEEEFRYDKETGIAFVKASPPGDLLTRAADLNHVKRNAGRPEWYNFDGQLLAEVLDQLSQYYQVEIYYYPSQVTNKYFSGRIEKTDSLETILSDIALLNNMEISKKNGSYIIVRKK